MIAVTVKYPAGHSYTEQWDYDEGVWCVYCGATEVWHDQGSGDYYVGAKYLCLACERSFYMSEGEGLVDSDKQRLEQIRKATRKLV